MMRIPVHRFVRRDAPREGTIKYWTHASAAAVILLVIPSLCALYVRHIGLEDGEPSWVRTAYAIWYTHGGLAALTALLWLVEKPRRTKFVTTESDLVEWPKEKPEQLDRDQRAYSAVARTAQLRSAMRRHSKRTLARTRAWLII